MAWSQTMFPHYAKGKGTIHAATHFHPQKDAETLKAAMKGLGCDRKTIIDIIVYRSNEQRQEIAREYKTLFGKDLVDDLKSELGGDLKNLIKALMTPHFTYLATELHDAVSGMGTNEDTLIEIICSSTNAQLYYIKEAYEEKFKKSLEKAVIEDTSGHLKKLLVSLLQGNRDESYTVDTHAAMHDAQELYEAGVAKWGTDESTFNKIMASRNYSQLQTIFIKYSQVAGHGLDEAIQKEFSGDMKKGLLAIFKCVMNKPAYFAERLRKSMEGIGTSDDILIRVIVSRSEIDLHEIKDIYSKIYDTTTLENDIKGDCSGDYKNCLLKIIGCSVEE